jgi:hypothetical protein
MDLDEQAVKIVAEAEALSEKDLRGALAKMREALALEPDYPNLEDEIFIREDAIAKLDGLLEFIVVLLREGKEYKACEMLQELPHNYIIQDKSGLVGGLVDKISRVAGLVEQARSADPARALPILEEAAKLVPDYPGLAEEIAALGQNVTQYNLYFSEIEKALQAKDAKKAAELLVGFQAAYPDDENGNKFKVAIINLSKNLKTSKDQKINLLKIFAAVGLVLAAGAAYFAYEMLMMKQAGRQWEEINRLLAAQKFTEVQVLGQDISKSLGRVRLFFLNGKQELQGKVEGVLQAELVVKGAQGKVLFDGGYVSKDQLLSSKAISSKVAEGKALAASGQYAEAVRQLEAVSALATGVDAVTSAKVAAETGALLTEYRLNIIKDLTAKAGASLAAGSYEAALTGINAALALAAEHTFAADEPLVARALTVKGKINRTKLQQLLAGGEQLFSAGNYEGAINSYEKARAFAKANELADEVPARRISGMIDKCRVKGLLDRGDRYLAAAKWPEAAKAYESGIALAGETGLRTFPAVGPAQVNLRTARKMQVVENLGGQRQLARQLVEEGKGQKAVSVFTGAIKAGEGSRWRGEKEVAAALADLKSGLGELEEKIFVDDKKEFLGDRYGTILKKEFALQGDVALLDPLVVLLTATPELLKFEISAKSYTKTGARSEYSHYEAVYIYDRKQAAWSLADKSSDTKATAE